MTTSMNNRYALVIGINYTGLKSELKGCINDAEKVAHYLRKNRGYKTENITILTDKTTPSATHENILSALSVLSHSHNAEELWFHYSGHGFRNRGLNSIAPMDYYKTGVIHSDQLQSRLKSLCCRMICLMDCCHSENMLSLKYRFEGSYANVVEISDSDVKSNIVMISGCKAMQKSMEKWSGVMTDCFLNCINQSRSYAELLTTMRSYLRKNHHLQTPRFYSSMKIIPDSPFPV
jgi:hypothetical protein